MDNIDLENIDAELNRCKEDFVYFYNNYCRREGEVELTEQKYSLIASPRLHVRRNRHNDNSCIKTIENLPSFLKDNIVIL